MKVSYSDSQLEQQREVKCEYAHPGHDYISLQTAPLIAIIECNSIQMKTDYLTWLLWDQIINVSF